MATVAVTEKSAASCVYLAGREAEGVEVAVVAVVAAPLETVDLVGATLTKSQVSEPLFSASCFFFCLPGALHCVLHETR